MLFGVNIEPLLSNKAMRIFRKAIMNFIEGFRTVLKKRSNNDRFCVIMLIIAFMLEMFTQYGGDSFFMYYRMTLRFGMSDFTTLFSIAGICGLIGQFVLVPFFTKGLQFHASVISLLGNINQS